MASLAVPVLLLPALAAQGQSRTVWDGIYTKTQAARGADAYVRHCSECHGLSLRGSGEARPLVGDRFWRDWGEDQLDSLFGVMKSEMPFYAPGSLSDREYIDILAYILQANDLPEGTQELAVDALNMIRVVQKDGAVPPPNFSLVTVVGCLSQGKNKEWMLTRATDPVRTRDPEAPVRAREREAPFGDHMFTLLFVPTEPETGRKARVVGLLIRAANGDRLNVTSLHTFDARCDP